MAILLIDFDGTCVTHEFPNIGKEIGAAPVLKALTENGHQLILFTMRCDHDGKETLDGSPSVASHGTYLTDAIEWFKKHDIPLYGINENPTQKSWTSSPKPYGEFIIDDIALGIPTLQLNGKRYVYWWMMITILELEGLITSEQGKVLHNSFRKSSNDLLLTDIDNYN